MTDGLAQYISEEYGERCPDFDNECIVCRLWHYYDWLMSKRRPLDEDETSEAIHWADRFGAGIDSYPQFDRLLPDERAL